MWESIDNSQQSKHNLSWLVEGMEFNTLTWVTDGSYDRKWAADMWSQMGPILQQNRNTSDWYILGEITSSKFIPCRNAWPMLPTPSGQRSFRIPSD
jgi:hypothetical protein